MNIYSHKFVAICPSDGEIIVYRLKIKSLAMIRVEHIKTATSLIKSGYHEQIADDLHHRFGGYQTIVATHQGVKIKSVRMPE